MLLTIAPHDTYQLVSHFSLLMIVFITMLSLPPDLCDDHEDKIGTGEVRVLSPIFQSYGKSHVFSGPIVIVKVFEDNTYVRDALEGPGNGQILVVDGGGSLGCALFGGDMAAMAEKNGWKGVIVDGCVRDVDEINECNIGVRALALHPQRSLKKGVGEKDVVVNIGGVRICPGEHLYADKDGVIVSKTVLSRS